MSKLRSVETSVLTGLRRALGLLSMVQLVGCAMALLTYFSFRSPAYWVQSGYDYRLDEKPSRLAIEDSEFKKLIKEPAGSKKFFEVFSPEDFENSATGPYWEAWIPLLSLVVTLLLRKVTAEVQQDASREGSNISTIEVLDFAHRHKGLITGSGLAVLLIVGGFAFHNNLAVSPTVHSGTARADEHGGDMRWTYAMGLEKWWTSPGDKSSMWKERFSGHSQYIKDHGARWIDESSSANATFVQLYVLPQYTNTFYSIVNFGLTTPILAYALILLGGCVNQVYKKSRNEVESATKPLLQMTLGKTMGGQNLLAVLGTVVAHFVQGKSATGETSSVDKMKMEFYRVLQNSLDCIAEFQIRFRCRMLYWIIISSAMAAFGTASLQAPPTLFFAATKEYTLYAFGFLAACTFIPIFYSILRFIAMVWYPLWACHREVNRVEGSTKNDRTKWLNACKAYDEHIAIPKLGTFFAIVTPLISALLTHIGQGFYIHILFPSP